MFSQDQDIVKKLLAENDQFRVLYDKHEELNDTVDKAGSGELPLSDDAMHDLKKEKLLLKDQMAQIIMNYKHNN